MNPTTIRAVAALTLAVAGHARGQEQPRLGDPAPKPPVVPGSFTGARPPGMPGGGLGGSSNIGGSPATGGGGLVGGPGMPGGLMGADRSWHCPRCQREVGRGAQPPASANCCPQFFVAGNTPPGGAAPTPASPELPPTQPPEEAAPAPVVASPGANAPAPAGNGGLVGLGVAVIVVGLIVGGVVVFLALRTRRGTARPRRRGAPF